jgi:uncharacterized membrane protein YecN with MAPEG domain
MAALPITTLTTGLLGLLLVVLSFRVIAVRRAGQVSLGTGGNAVLEKRMRSHANFCEYVPFCLILLGLLEAGAMLPTIALCGLATLLLVARLAHPFGLEGAGMIFRMVGMIGTFTVVIAGAVTLLAHSLGGM